MFTLYGVQPGETYTVEITPYVLFRVRAKMVYFQLDSCFLIWTSTYTFIQQVYHLFHLFQATPMPSLATVHLSCSSEI